MDYGTEIQIVPALFDNAQYIFDKDIERFNFFLAGSSSRQIKTGSANLLSGRTHFFRMTPVLQAEQRNKVMAIPLMNVELRQYQKRLNPDCGRPAEEGGQFLVFFSTFVL
ncbi:MAG: AAA family ATPase [Spirochaetaceae bacterium]|nr:AAA family ATPase [Spirochaetaceae bacterium]